MAEHGELGQRKAAVLHTVVEEYVRTGEPVGSETIAERAGLRVWSARLPPVQAGSRRTGGPAGPETTAERAGLGVSSATIRNEMAALEELGFLSHPHTSARPLPPDARRPQAPGPPPA